MKWGSLQSWPWGSSLPLIPDTASAVVLAALSLGNRLATSTQLLPAWDCYRVQTGVSAASPDSWRLGDTVFMSRINRLYLATVSLSTSGLFCSELIFYNAINIAHYIFITYAVFLPTHRNFIELFSFIPFLHIVRSHPEFLLYRSPSVKKQ